MDLAQRFNGLLNCIFSFVRRIFVESEPVLRLEEKTTEENTLKELDENITSEDGNEEEKINVHQRTLMTKLYILEQEITILESTFPEEHKAFLERIQVLRESYNSSVEEIKKLLTFEIDPDSNLTKIGEVAKLELEVKRFIEKDVKFSIITQKLQRLITKLNILYNVSIFHSNDSEKEKVISQLKRALESERKVVKELQECDVILNDKQLKDRIVSLISYIDYEIFKTTIRNSNKMPEEILKSLVILTEFDEFDYVGIFKAFIIDEVSDLQELINLIYDEEYKRALNKELTNILTKLTYSKDMQNKLLSPDFWKQFLNFESNLFEILKIAGVEKEKIKVKLIDTMNVNVDESDVFSLPMTNANLSLTSLYAETHDERIFVLLKFLKNLSNDITYKEIYFLLLLFGVMEIVKKIPNELFKHVEKYLEKYQYDEKTIRDKKDMLKNSLIKEFVVAFHINDYEEAEIVKTLEGLEIDFTLENGNVLINSFYFNGLKNVSNNLKKA